MQQPSPAPESLFMYMDDESFQRISTYVTREYGIKLPPTKRSMLESRLNKKVKSLGMNNYQSFVNYIFSDEGKSTVLLDVIDLITTNKTDFFREPAHFTFLSTHYLPKFVKGGNDLLNIWSAGCSTGEEPYTTVIVLEEFKKRNPGLRYNVLASDVSMRVMQAAHEGIYTVDKLSGVPQGLRPDYFLRSKSDADLVRVKPQYRNKISYKRINLMNDSFGMGGNVFNIIFCRNVLIYFDKQRQEAVIRKFAQHLRPGGLLFLGHSESIMGMDVPFRQIRPTTYERI